MKKNRLSVAVFPLNIGGSNATQLEFESIFVPPYNAGHFGIYLTSSPKQCDLLVITGIGTVKAAEHAMRLVESLSPDVKLLVLGSDTISGAPFASCYGVAGPIQLSESVKETDLKLSVGRKIDAYLAGSPPDPQSILNAILELYQAK
ncbi:MAG: hypothetical protein HXX08_04790 [Chloroflexi bacterium]|uniref:NADH:ubiquinone oxidoreductase-like 20kDa subunit domain-containing protein n=1 Tax=Candidatus Chlorohelix allophototropha TaxID=3003348 RepID=A0A8T7LZZ4_9CHLR|nr:hypothetical protein [Chloroflexota bacterium]WJW67058.1 hypothetical protein OZ401_000306 [Chloroflexota bacterium L227-S17]